MRSTLERYFYLILIVNSFFTTSCSWQSYILTKQNASVSPTLRASKIVITQQPTDVSSMTNLTIRAELRNDQDEIVNVNDTVTLSFHSDTSGATASLLGTIAVQAVAGVVEFSAAKIDLPGVSYVLRLSTNDLSAVNTTPVSVNSLNLNVTPMYPTNGSNLLNFVVNDYTKKRNQLADTACATSLSNFPTACVHAGEIRKVELPGWTSCQGLTLTENLGVFDWVCVEGSPAYFYSRAFKTGKGIKDLVGATTFLANRVTITKLGIKVAESQLSTTWWSNPIQNLTLNSGGADPALSLNLTNTIYTISSSGSSRGIQFSADYVALVILGNNTLSPTGSLVLDCDLLFGGQQACLIFSGSTSKRGWIEGNINMTSAVPAIWLGTFVGSTAGWRIHNLNITGSGNFTGIRTESSATSSHFTDIKITGNGSGFGIYRDSSQYGTINNIKIEKMNYGIWASGGTGWYLRIHKAQIANCTTTGIGSPSWYWSIINSQVYNNGTNGIDFTGYYSIIANSLSSNNGGIGMNIPMDTSVVLYSTTANNSSTGFNISNTGFTKKTHSEGLLSTNNSVGISSPSDNGTFRNTMVTDNGTGITLTGTSNANSFTGKLIVGTNGADCNITSTGLNPGLLGASCNNQGTSDAVRVSGVTAYNYFTGAVNSESVNAHGSGLSLENAISDWLNFSNSFRIWGLEGTQSNSALRGRCVGAVNCRIWDWSLTQNAVEALNVNGSITNGATCPSSLHGDQTFTYVSNTGVIPALRAALEIMEDDLGNEDGLCNSGESCYFTPNIGVFQGGPGPLSNQCNFVNGVGANAVSNAKIFAW